jgi:predicted permease
MNLFKDLRYAARLLRRSPGFTAIAVLTLALGIGANTAVFSVVDAIFFRPLPYPNPGALAQVVLFWHGKGASGDNAGMTGRNWELVRNNASLLEAAALGGVEGVNLVSGGHPHYVREERVSASFLDVLGVRPVLGRGLRPEEDRDGGPNAAVLSYHLWQNLFRGDPDIAGRSIVIRGEPVTVVGVMPREFRTNAPKADLWGPLRPSTKGEGEGSNYEIIARLKPGASWTAADQQLASVSAHDPDFKPDPGGSLRLGIVPLQQGLARDARSPAYILWAAVGALLLITCLNVAGLLFARGIERSRESATRLALGCPRIDVLRPLIAESALLAFLGGAAGIALAYAAIQGLSQYAQVAFSFRQEIRLDWRVLLAAAAIALITCILSGLTPALATTNIDIREALSESGARGTSGRRTAGIRRSLIVAEVTMGMVLLIGAGLLVRTFLYLNGETPGFDPRNVIAANASVHEVRYSTPGALNRLFDESLGRIRAIPGVEGAAVALGLPYERALNVNIQKISEMSGPIPDYGIINLVFITPGYFNALRIPILHGRDISEADTAQTRPVMIVNEAAARWYLDHHNPIGMHIGLGGPPAEVIGVAGNVLQGAGWGAFGPSGAVPCIYMPMSQTKANFLSELFTFFEPSWIARTSAASPDIAVRVQHAIEATDPGLPLSSVRSMDEVKHAQFAEQQFRAAMLSAMAALGLMLAATGIYGLIARSVLERTREMGIRMAFGATPGDAIKTVVGPGLKLTSIGLLAGVGLALLSAKVLQHLIFGITSTDPITFVAACATLLAVALIASIIPALRLVRLNPADALRHE